MVTKWRLAMVALALQSVALLVAAARDQQDICSTLVNTNEGGYTCNDYVARTQDGFLLGIQRIGAGETKNPKKPVLLMHGILSGGDTWLLNTPDQSLGFILADAGYDVWIGNIRTTDYSHGHEVYSLDDKEYWDWSVDELASNDLVAMVEMVYQTTNMRMHYVGFSQGTQSAFAALSQGLLVDWLDKLVMLAPIAYIKHTKTPIGILGAKLQLDKLFGRLKFYSLSTRTSSGREYIDIVCAATNIGCFDGWITVFTGANCCLNNSRRYIYDKYETQATSTKNLQHLAQSYRNGDFARYDYGEAENMRRYNAAEPPSYDLSNISTDRMFLIYGKNDVLADVDDVMELRKQLPQGIKTKFVENYAHLDFIVGYNANEVVYRDVLDFLHDA